MGFYLLLELSVRLSCRLLRASWTLRRTDTLPRRIVAVSTHFDVTTLPRTTEDGWCEALLAVSVSIRTGARRMIWCIGTCI